MQMMELMVANHVGGTVYPSTTRSVWSRAHRFNPDPFCAYAGQNARAAKAKKIHKATSLRRLRASIAGSCPTWSSTSLPGTATSSPTRATRLDCDDVTARWRRPSSNDATTTSSPKTATKKAAL